MSYLGFLLLCIIMTVGLGSNGTENESGDDAQHVQNKGRGNAMDEGRSVGSVRIVS